MYDYRFNEDYIAARQQALEAEAQKQRVARAIRQNTRANRQLKPAIIALIVALQHK